MRIHQFLMIAGLIVILSACGSGNSLPAAVPSGSASGTVLDGLILNGTVTAYDFSSGSKGTVLGTATTDSATGAYSLSLQVETRPILLEITGGYYTEEAAPQTTSTVTLASTDNLTALINYTTGQTVTVSVTAFTHLAAGLAEYEIKTGVPVAAAINDANQRVSQLAGLDIIHTTPVEVTDINNASANPTPSIEYGLLAAGISQWVFGHTPTGAAAGTQPYTSIKFDQLMHDDVAADGVLDGQGFDANGVKIPLSFGTTALSPAVYRQGIGVSMLAFATSANNKTGLTAANSTSLLDWAEAYAANTDKMFDGVAPASITTPAVSILNPYNNSTNTNWWRGTTTVQAGVVDYSGLTSVTMSIDGGAPQAATGDLSAPTWPLNTASLGDGSHTVNVIATNAAGLTGAATLTFRADNTPPTLTVSAVVNNTGYLGSSNGTCTVSGTVSDTASGVSAPVAISVAYGGSCSVNLVNDSYSCSVAYEANGYNYYTDSNYNWIVPITVSTMDNAGNAAVAQTNCLVPNPPQSSGP